MFRVHTARLGFIRGATNRTEFLGGSEMCDYRGDWEIFWEVEGWVFGEGDLIERGESRISWY